MSNDIEGKVVVITGASSGLGEATARFLSAHGANTGFTRKWLPTVDTLRNFFEAPPPDLKMTFELLRQGRYAPD